MKSVVVESREKADRLSLEHPGEIEKGRDTVGNLKGRERVEREFIGGVGTSR